MTLKTGKKNQKMDRRGQFCVANVAKNLRFRDFLCLAISENKIFLKCCNVAF